MRRKNILFIAHCYKNWMGGIYYIKNQIVQLLSYAPAKKNLRIFLYISKKNVSGYEELNKYKNVKIILEEELSEKIFVQTGAFILDGFDTDIAYLTIKYHISFLFPYFPRGRLNRGLFLRKSISWIPDFQHIHLPELFSRGELMDRERQYEEMARRHNKLVLSSQDSLRDYQKKYPDHMAGVYVIPFCSALDQKAVVRNDVDRIRNRYGIKGDYFIICNQFWVHKNHMTVFRALKQVLENGYEIRLVCTGDLHDYRNRKYIDGIRNYITEHKLQDYILLSGLVDKYDQIQLMKGAVAIIQPSLCEGWGTGVEDAKTLGKQILLSDIAVHHEQMDDNCQLFEAENVIELSGLMVRCWRQKEYPRKAYYSLKEAKKYGELFYRMLFH